MPPTAPKRCEKCPGVRKACCAPEFDKQLHAWTSRCKTNKSHVAVLIAPDADWMFTTRFDKKFKEKIAALTTEKQAWGDNGKAASAVGVVQPGAATQGAAADPKPTTSASVSEAGASFAAAKLAIKTEPCLKDTSSAAVVRAVAACATVEASKAGISSAEAAALTAHKTPGTDISSADGQYVVKSETSLAKTGPAVGAAISCASANPSETGASVAAAQPTVVADVASSSVGAVEAGINSAKANADAPTTHTSATAKSAGKDTSSADVQSVVKIEGPPTNVGPAVVTTHASASAGVPATDTSSADAQFVANTETSPTNSGPAVVTAAASARANASEMGVSAAPAKPAAVAAATSASVGTTEARNCSAEAQPVATAHTNPSAQKHGSDTSAADIQPIDKAEIVIASTASASATAGGGSAKPFAAAGSEGVGASQTGKGVAIRIGSIVQRSRASAETPKVETNLEDDKPACAAAAFRTTCNTLRTVTGSVDAKAASETADASSSVSMAKAADISSAEDQPVVKQELREPAAAAANVHAHAGDVPEFLRALSAVFDLPHQREELNYRLLLEERAIQEQDRSQYRFYESPWKSQRVFFNTLVKECCACVRFFAVNPQAVLADFAVLPCDKKAAFADDSDDLAHTEDFLQ
eukprot:TRINITY_DN102840_c0_g1_i1.p1 TRINITY_DN102840_c0_g1~~TRINITY_DN102840_c0_g1_i1.p1  ORF type:complete len:654 (+),score=151.90 TRINITY_DN102840_c0_g1_i1:32-1963(+)